MATLSIKAFAFNILTRGRSDDEKDYLYYGDPDFFMTHCKKRYSLGASVSHDEELGEFTICVRLAG